MTLPHSHIVDANTLEGADGIVELFEIALIPSGNIYVKANDTVTWQGNTYEGIAIKLTGVSGSSDDEKSRPGLQVANPEGIFTPFIRTGKMEKAMITRVRVLRSDVLANNNIAQRESWYVSRTVSLNRMSASFELREAMDGQFFILPARQFLPPEFPAVKLS